MIGPDVVITVLEVRGDQVRIGIKAPRSVDVHREEVFAALQKANRSAASPSSEALDALGALKPVTDRGASDESVTAKPPGGEPSAPGGGEGTAG